MIKYLPVSLIDFIYFLSYYFKQSVYFSVKIILFSWAILINQIPV